MPVMTALRRLFLLCLALGSPALSALPWGFEAAASFGMGEADEIVYRDSKVTDYLSELVWPRSPGVGGSLTATIPWSQALATRVTLRGTWSPLPGIMSDSDWDIPYDSSQPHNNVNSKTPAYLLNDWSAQVEQAWAVDPEAPWLALAGVRLDQLAWESWTHADGDYQVWTPLDGSSSFSLLLNGLVITYRMTRVVPYLGFEYHLPLGDATFSAALRASPFVYVADVDYHTPSDVYFDTSLGGYEVAPSLEFSLPWEDRLLGLRLAGAKAVGARGDAYYVRARNSGGAGTTYTGVAGAEWQDWRLEVFVRQ